MKICVNTTITINECVSDNTNIACIIADLHCTVINRLFKITISYTHIISLKVRTISVPHQIYSKIASVNKTAIIYSDVPHPRTKLHKTGPRWERDARICKFAVFYDHVL